MTTKQLAQKRDERNPRRYNDQQLVEPAKKVSAQARTQGTLQQSLQEIIITLLVHDDKAGRILADEVTAAEFEGDYAEIARCALGYWKEYDQPPKQHMDELLDHIITDSKNPKFMTFRSIVQSMLQTYDTGINAEFVLDEMWRFKREQEVRKTILDSAHAINSNKSTRLEEVENMLTSYLDKSQHYKPFDPGLTFDDIDAVLDNLESRSDEFMWGIEELDSRNIVPAREQVMLLLGATGSGKSWALIHIGKMAAGIGHNVLHVSLEMSEKDVMLRYYQNLYYVPVGTADISIPRSEYDGDGHLVGIHAESHVPEFRLDRLDRTCTTRELRTRGRSTIARGMVRHLKVKHYPSGTLTVSELRGCLKRLKASGFAPDMVIVDYVGIMQTSVNEKQDLRHQLKQILIGLREIAVEYNVAVVTAQQVSREGAKADNVRHTHVAEAWGLNTDADKVITYSQTEREAKRQVARLYVAKARGAPDKFTVVIGQSYAIGQFCIDSALHDERYADALGAEGGTNVLGPDKITDLVELLGEGQWRRDVRAKENWAGNAVSQVLGIDPDTNSGKARCTAILNRLIEDGILCVFKANDERAKKPVDFIGPKCAGKGSE